VLEQLGQDIWGSVADYHLGLLAIPHRMTVMRAAGGGLLLHSPGKPDAQTRKDLESLGAIEAIVWPSWWHDLYLHEWAAAYPNARICVAPGLRSASRSIPNLEVVRQSSSVWPDVEQIHVDRLAMNFDELVFFHRPSGSMIVADLVTNVHQDVNAFTNIFLHVIGAYPGPRIPGSYLLVVRERKYVRAKLDQMLAWDFDRLIVGHGDVVAPGGKAAFEKACAAFIK